MRGERVQTIAKDLYLSQSTVRNHLVTIFQKFGVHSQTELIVDAHEQGATVVVATHALEFAEVAHRCIGLRDGELAYDGEATVEQVERLVT